MLTRTAELVELPSFCNLCGRLGEDLDGGDDPGAIIVLEIVADTHRRAKCCVECARSVGKALRAGWSNANAVERGMRADLVGAVLDQLDLLGQKLREQQSSGNLTSREGFEMSQQLREIRELVAEFPNTPLPSVPAPTVERN